MKIIIIGDIHGRTIWKDIISKEFDADKYIFLGDYFDPYDDYKPQELIDNFEDIVTFKRSNMDKVILLVGNHDSSYITTNVVSCRYSYNVHNILGDRFRNLILKEELFQLCYSIPTRFNDIICSHAGFTNTWLRDNRLQLNVNELNETYYIHLEHNSFNRIFDFIDKGSSDPYGDDVYQGPLWIRPRALRLDKPVGCYQIVGHTRPYGISNRLMNDINLHSVNLCDTLEVNKYWIFEEKDFNIKFYDVNL